LTDGSTSLPGNLGLWDQIMALQFVHDNIAAWNGDPKRVTIMGHSSGAICVSALTLSAHANTLFQRAMSLSNPALGGSFSEQVVQDGKEFIEATGCKLENNEKTMKCLKRLTIDELLDAQDRVVSFFRLLLMNE
uniref:COesterase domain-containing protein n=1 Tax=Gongylonema pulchrum TaxID=637853 RepID=A0A183DIZ5_9BILA